MNQKRHGQATGNRQTATANGNGSLTQSRQAAKTATAGRQVNDNGQKHGNRSALPR
jgi:hypothetical protein